MKSYKTEERAREREREREKESAITQKPNIRIEVFNSLTHLSNHVRSHVVSSRREREEGEVEVIEERERWTFI